MRVCRRNALLRKLALAGAWVLWLLPAAASAQDKPAQDKPIGEAPEERDADEIFLRNQRVLLGRGQAVLDFGQFYSRADTLQLAVVNGGVALGHSRANGAVDTGRGTRRRRARDGGVRRHVVHPPAESPVRRHR